MLQGTTYITATVVDEYGTPIPSANVYYKDTNIGVITNANGQFTIAENSNYPLVISYVGLGTITFEPGATIPQKIDLVTMSEQLSEVVVTPDDTKKSSAVWWWVGGLTLATVLTIVALQPKTEKVTM